MSFQNANGSQLVSVFESDNDMSAVGGCRALLAPTSLVCACFWSVDLTQCIHRRMVLIFRLYSCKFGFTLFSSVLRNAKRSETKAATTQKIQIRWRFVVSTMLMCLMTVIMMIDSNATCKHAVWVLASDCGECHSFFFSSSCECEAKPAESFARKFDDAIMKLIAIFSAWHRLRVSTSFCFTREACAAGESSIYRDFFSQFCFW